MGDDIHKASGLNLNLSCAFWSYNNFITQTQQQRVKFAKTSHLMPSESAGLQHTSDWCRSVKRWYFSRHWCSEMFRFWHLEWTSRRFSCTLTFYPFSFFYLACESEFIVVFGVLWFSLAFQFLSIWFLTRCLWFFCVSHLWCVQSFPASFSWFLICCFPNCTVLSH